VITATSRFIVGVRDLEASFAKMAKIKEACDEAGIDYPEAVKDYFKEGTNRKFTAGENIALLREEMETVDITVAISRPVGGSSDAWEIDLSKLPKDVKAVRFINSY
jgi:hypothetical protein